LTRWKLNGGGNPDWSPDGKRILFRTISSDELHGNIYTIRPDGSGLRQLTHYRRATIGSRTRSHRTETGSRSPSRAFTGRRTCLSCARTAPTYAPLLGHGSLTAPPTGGPRPRHQKQLGIAKANPPSERPR
jgi:hypothetical protein